MNLNPKNQIKNLFAPSVVVYKDGKKVRKVKNKFLKEFLVHKTQYGYHAILDFAHRDFEIDGETGSDGTIGVSLSFKPRANKKKEVEHTLIVEFKLPKGKKFQLAKAKRKNQIELFFLPQGFSENPNEWSIYEFSK